MKFAKKILAVSSTLTLIAGSLMPIAAATNSTGNSVTGYDSKNISEVENKNDVMVSNISDTRVVNHVETVSSTGGSSSSYNTMGGSVSSGNASNTVGILTTGNINTTTLSLGGTQGSNLSGNGVTGAESFNKSEVENSNRVKVFNDNTSVVTNHVEAESKTGNNDADYNTGAGSVMSGSASTAVNVVNHLNDTATALHLGQGGTGGNKSLNSTTGYDSDNISEIENNNDVMVSNISDARVLNDIETFSGTGRNSSNKNTLGGSVHSGNASTGVGLDTTANVNTTTIAVAMGGFAQESGNSITGAKSLNVSEVDNSNKFAVYNENNKGLSKDAPDYCKAGTFTLEDRENLRECWGVFNFDEDFALTGNNDTDYNTGLGHLLSGVAAIQKTVKTWLNDNFVAIEP